jgi:hypothetical protein
MSHYLSLRYYLLFKLSTLLLNFPYELSVRSCSYLFCLLCVARIWGLWCPYMPLEAILSILVHKCSPKLSFCEFGQIWRGGYPFLFVGVVGGWGVAAPDALDQAPGGSSRPAENVQKKALNVKSCFKCVWRVWNVCRYSTKILVWLIQTRKKSADFTLLFNV